MLRCAPCSGRRPTPPNTAPAPLPPQALLEFEGLWYQAWLRGIDIAKAQLQATLLAQDSSTGAWWGGAAAWGPADLPGLSPACLMRCHASSLKLPPCPLSSTAGGLVVNFDAEVLQLMREARYLQRLGLGIPPSARMVLLQQEKFTLYYNQLTHALRVRCLAGGCLAAAAGARLCAASSGGDLSSACLCPPAQASPQHCFSLHRPLPPPPRRSWTA